MMDFLTDEHRDILRGMKRDRDAGDLEENEYAQERAHVIKMARQEFDAQLDQCNVAFSQSSALRQDKSRRPHARGVLCPPHKHQRRSHRGPLG